MIIEPSCAELYTVFSHEFMLPVLDIYFLPGIRFMGERLGVGAESASHCAIPPASSMGERRRFCPKKRNPYQWESASVPSTRKQNTSETGETGFIAMVLADEVFRILLYRFQVYLMGIAFTNYHLSYHLCSAVGLGHTRPCHRQGIYASLLSEEFSGPVRRVLRIFPAPVAPLRHDLPPQEHIRFPVVEAKKRHASRSTCKGT